MSAATYFWSSTLNAFLFKQGPMTPTLIDIKMLTGLDIQSEINPFSLLANSSHKLKPRRLEAGPDIFLSTWNKDQSRKENMWPS